MGLDLELAGKLETVMEASANKAYGSVSNDPENKLIKSISNRENKSFDMEASLDKQTMEPDGTEDLELDIINCMTTDDTGLIRNEYQDATENSSSFSDTGSGIEGAVSSDAEVQSQFYGGNTLTSVNDGCEGFFRVRKKKLTDHWRSFVHPLMWRCKWIELKIKEFQSQASKYDRELAESNRTKLFELEKFRREGVGVKSLPFFGHNRKKKIMRRKKRTRFEDTTEVASYMSHHNLFSYYEIKKSSANGASMTHGCVKLDKTLKGDLELGVDDALLEFMDSDNSLEQVLLKISMAQSRVHKLKDRIDKVVSENAGKVPSTNNLGLLVPCDAKISSSPSPASPPGNRCKKPFGPMYTAPRIPDHSSLPDVVFPKSAVLSHKDATVLPDIIGNTHHPQVEGSLKTDGQGNFGNGSKEELHNFEEGKVQSIEKNQERKKERESIIPPAVANPHENDQSTRKKEQESTIPPAVAHLHGNDQSTQKKERESTIPPAVVHPHGIDQSTQKFRSISQLSNASRKKRKRATRKAGGRWSRRSSG